MFKWTTTSFVNGDTYLDGKPAWFSVKSGTITNADGTTASTDNTTEESFTIAKNVKFFKGNVTGITKAKYTLPELAELKIDFSQAALAAGDYRFYLYIRAIGNADPLYANAFVYKGRPLYIEFTAKGTASTDTTAFVKTANKWIKLLYGNGNIVEVTKTGSTEVTIKATNEYQKFYVAEIQKYDATALAWAHDGAFVTLMSSDPNADAYDASTFTMVKTGSQGYGTYTQLIKDLRLPTNANTRFFRDQENEMPLVTGKYWQYVFTQCTDRPEVQGTSVLGQYNKSITTHVVFVEDSVQKAFDTAVTTFYGSAATRVQNAAEKEANDPSKFSSVSPVGTENPSTEGWYVIDQNGDYVLTTDTTVDSNATYYDLA